MAQENYFLRTSSGPSCGPGDHEALLQSGGASTATKTLDSTGDTWGYAESARELKAGTWQTIIYYDSSRGNGPQNKIRVLVELRDSSCSVKETLLDQTVVISKGVSGGMLNLTQSNGVVTVEDGDVVTVTVFKTQGNQTVKIRYDGTFPQNAISRLSQPGLNIIDSIGRVSWIELEVPDA